MRAPNIILVGMMGAGKSAVGRELAKLLRRPLADIDGEIARRAGKSISDIFAGDGEDAFRKMESEELARALQKNGCIIAAGGGAILAPQNAKLMRAGGTVFYLCAPPKLLAARARPQNRPLLARAKNPEKTLAKLLREREPLYRKTAHCTITVGENETPADVAAKIIAIAKSENSAAGKKNK